MRAQWTAIMRLWQGPCPLARPNHEAMHIKRRVPVGKEDMRLDGREKAEGMPALSEADPGLTETLENTSLQNHNKRSITPPHTTTTMPAMCTQTY